MRRMEFLWSNDQVKVTEVRLWHTLSGEQDLLSIARQPQPGWSLSVREHLYPVHELLAAATNGNSEYPNNDDHICLFTK